MITLRTAREIEKIRRSCRVVGLAHRAIQERIRPGISTGELDRVAEAVVQDHGAVPAFKGYRGYPATTCISVNEQVVHAIPGRRALEEGDIVSVDIGVKLQGYYGDQAFTFAVGEISREARNLMEVTREALHKGIRAARCGGRLADICGAVQNWVESHGLSIVRQFVGHGIGRELHEEPAVPNYLPVERNPRLRKGMVLAIEPMVNLGGPDVTVADDGWTASATDARPSAHYEHVVAITGQACEVLTMSEEEMAEGG